MLQIEINAPDGKTTLMQVADESIIGKGAQSEIRLDSWRVAKEHARLFKTPGGVLLEDMGAFSGVMVNRQRIDNQYGPLKASDVIEIGPFKIKVSELGVEGGLVQAAHSRSRSDTAAYRNQQATDEIKASRAAAEQAQQAALRAREAARDAEAQQDSAGAGQAASDAPGPAATPGFELIIAPDPSVKQREFEWRKKIHAALLETMDLRRHDVSAMSDEKLRADTDRLVVQLIKDMEQEIPQDLDRKLLRKQVLDEAVGLGPLEELLADDGVSEIMVNRFDEIFVERSGRLMRHPLTFTGDRAVMGVIERIVAPLGRRIDESSPMVDARLKDGSRVNAIIAPLPLKGPALTIRK
ncbi:MAG: Flp pilus assembly complex ATPase component TadA, partial [Microbacteriaceae bacterium]|nr:Flp pilus assembly complex ATPase component TadA [Burkholderiaceae bacterium]